ncbi:MAG: thiamine phosphate synthase [Proteobacteria bacterium]|nr:thiamine phosphate synthase [Pseudomonadota bacterium]
MTDKLAHAKLARAAAALNAHSGTSLPPLVLVTDDVRLADPLASARILPRGSMIVLRARQDARRAQLAAELRELTRSRKIKLLIANDAALAVRVGADGIHLSQAAAHAASHWRALHPYWIITAAAHSLASSHVADADALFVAPVFPTKSHPGGKSLGAIGLRIIAGQSTRPIYALGGIDAARAAELKGARLAGLAAIGALAV